MNLTLAEIANLAAQNHQRSIYAYVPFNANARVPFCGNVKDRTLHFEFVIKAHAERQYSRKTRKELNEH
jgi:hypothetical protein